MAISEYWDEKLRDSPQKQLIFGVLRHVDKVSVGM